MTSYNVNKILYLYHSTYIKTLLSYHLHEAVLYVIHIFLFFLPLISNTLVLTGKELFNFNASLFVDDEGALDAAQENAMNMEMLALREAEERMAEEEAERAQQRQKELREAEEIEEAYRQRKIQEVCS